MAIRSGIVGTRRSYHGSFAMSNEKKPVPFPSLLEDAYSVLEDFWGWKRSVLSFVLSFTYAPTAFPQQRDQLKRMRRARHPTTPGVFVGLLGQQVTPSLADVVC
jgi:hypothetical protein